MPIEILKVGAKYSSVKLRMQTSDGHRFFMQVRGDEISFWSDESSAGTLSGIPINKSADDLLKWFGDEGKKKPFKERKQVAPKNSA